MDYNLGELVTVRGEWSAPVGGPLDPDEVYLSFENPAGTVTTWQYGVDSEIVRDDDGKYSARIDANAPGDWFYRWWSTGEGQSAKFSKFKVKPARALYVAED